MAQQRTARDIEVEAGDRPENIESELELLAGKVLLTRGELEPAMELLTAAANHLTDPAQRPELAGQLLSLAKAWRRRKDPEQSTLRVQEVLRTAARVDPFQGVPALAQHFDRHERWSEAVLQWREAIRLDQAEGVYYLNLARAHEKAGQPEQALATYLELMDKVPSARNYLVVAQRLDELVPALPAPMPDQTVRIALLGNSTLDHLRNYLKVEAYRTDLRPEMYQCDFDQYTQDILNPQSRLYAFSPDVALLAVHASRLFPRIHDYPFDLTVAERRAEIDAGLDAVQNLLDALTGRSSALVLLHNMVAPQYPALGILDWREEQGQAELFAEINARLAAMVRSRYRNVYVVDEDRIQARLGKAVATDPRLWLTSRLAWGDAALAALAKEYMRFVKPLKARSRKCIVLDLDNTLWGGIVGEDGIAGIQLGADAPGNAFSAFQKELERLWRRGILLAICSKNNEEDVLAVFEQHPDMTLTLSHFAARRINWAPKAANIREIARELNIGLDSLVFLDDNPVERAKVRAELPQVLVPELPTDPAYFRQALLELDVFETLMLTEEDRRRNQMYAEQQARRESEAAHLGRNGSLEDYLVDLGMSVDIEPASRQTLARIAQLTNKTNQFNLTTKRYNEAEIANLQAAGAEAYSIRVADRFGDNGVVGVGILRPKSVDTWEIDTLLLSCRVLGRAVETALLAFLADRARQSGMAHLQGWYLPTAKNAPARDCYRDHGFGLIEQRSDGSALWDLDLTTTAIDIPVWLAVRAPERVG